MAIKPAGKSPIAQIWYPSTKTYPNGPPNHPAQWVLGMDSGPGTCIVGKVPFAGMLMMMVGDTK